MGQADDEFTIEIVGKDADDLRDIFARTSADGERLAELINVYEASTDATDRANKAEQIVTLLGSLEMSLQRLLLLQTAILATHGVSAGPLDTIAKAVDYFKSGVDAARARFDSAKAIFGNASGVLGEA